MTLKRIPVDISRLGGWVVMSAPEPRIDPTTGEFRRDREGRTVFLVGVAVKPIGPRQKAVVLELQVTSELIDITEGVIVQVEGLEAVPWEIEGRSGLSYQVSSIRMVSPGLSGAVAVAPVAAGARGKGAGGDQ